MLHAALAALILISGVPADASEPAASPPPATAAGAPFLTDAEGDARDHNAASAQNRVVQGCRSAIGWGTVTPGGLTCAGLPVPPPDVGGVPADPAFDIVAVHIDETPDKLTFTIEVASIDPSFAFLGGPESGVVDWVVCMRPATTTLEDGRCTEAVTVYAIMDAEGTATTAGALDTISPECQAWWWWCGWGLEHEIVPGTPGLVRAVVPRPLLQDDEQGATIERVWAYTTVARTEDRKQMEVNAAGFRRMANTGGETRFALDITPEAPLTLQLASSDAPLAFTDSTLDPPRDGMGPLDPIADLLEMKLVETPETLTLANRMARVDPEATQPLWMDFYLSIYGGYGIYAWYYQTDTGPEWAAIGCATEDCSLLAVPMNVTTSPGEDGWVNVTFRRADIGAPQAGTLLGLVGMDAVAGKETKQEQGPAFIMLSEGTGVEWFGYSKPYALRMDTALDPADDGPTIFEDESGDARLGPLARAAQASGGQFDLTSLRIDERTPTTTRITLGVADLSRVVVPDSHRGVLYAIAAETDAGSFMAGFYKETGRQEFFCAQDTTVLTDARRDPNEVVWSPIEGLVTLAREGTGTAGGATRGSISLVVPHECLGVSAPGPVAVKRVAAGTYLIPQRNALAVEVVDEMRPETPVTFGVSSAQTAKPWYDSPFGIPEFWNIAGIAIAGTISLFGLIVVRRKRGILKRYLREADGIALASDADERVTGLARLLQAAKEDVIRGLLEQGHFALVDERIGDHLSRARIDAFHDAFGDLPLRLAKHLERFLRDGRLTAEEMRLVETMLDDAGLTADAKTRLLSKLRAWAVAHGTTVETPA